MLPCINALSGWGFISTVPLRKPRFYAVSGTCFCRYLSEYSNNDHFSCMLTIWTYLIVTITTWIFFSITLFLHFVIRYFYIFPITNSLMLQFMDKPDLDKFHACIEIWQISRTKWMPVHEQNKVAKQRRTERAVLRMGVQWAVTKLVRRRNHCTGGLS